MFAQGKHFNIFHNNHIIRVFIEYGILDNGLNKRIKYF